MKIGIAGCGLNSDYHIRFAKSYPGARIAGLCDRDLYRANACAERHGLKGVSVFSSIGEMSKRADPDVIHIVTPPKTHYFLASEAIRCGRHALVEKPLALNARDAEDLFEMAARAGVKLCTMHNHLFDPCMARARELVREGGVGEIMSVESYYGINSRIPALREYPGPNVLPWIYDLPGGPYQDFMAHPLYVMLDYTGEPKEIKVAQKSHGVLPQGLPDEIRVLIDGEKALGTLAFSFAARPHMHFIRIYGSKMMVEADINTMSTVIHPVSSLPKAARKAAFNIAESWQLFRQTVSNAARFAAGRLKPYQGMETLMHGFYDSIKTGGEPPVSRRQALAVIRTMDEIWRQLRIRPLDFSPRERNTYPYEIRHREKILVTGGTGFLGKKLVRTLTAEGYPVRVLARKLADTEFPEKAGAEIFFGDVADPSSLAEAVRGADVLIHAAAGTSGTKRDSETGTLEGTRNVLKQCKAAGVKKLIYISSCSVYGINGLKKNRVVTEESPLERFPSKRGYYSAFKQQAEGLVAASMGNGGPPAVILRPGTIYGPGGDVFTPMMGFSLFRRAFVVIGMGGFELPIVHIDNVVEAIVKCVRMDEANNQIFNIVDDEKITKRRYMKELIRRLYPGAPVIYLPYPFLYSITLMQEALMKFLDKPPVLTRYRLASSQRKVRYDSGKAVKTLDWRPAAGFEQAAPAIIEYERQH